MKIQVPFHKASIALASALVMLGVVPRAGAAAPALNASLDFRPLTPTEISQYGLGTAQKSAGIQNVGIGEPVYLEADINLLIDPSTITSVTWSLTNRPLGSVAALTNSPLGTNVPVYRMADRLTLQVAGRSFFRPDVAGVYTVQMSVVTSGSGSTNITRNIVAGTFLGANTCALCHSGGAVAPNKYIPWQGTDHATTFTRAIDGLLSNHFGQSCVVCHSTGYDSNTNAVNGGFDDVAAALGWTFPTVLTNGNWAAMPDALKNLANVQCEDCHGPGSQHAYSLGDTNLIAKTWSAGDCNQCHDSMTHHTQGTEWNNSMHAITTRIPSGPGRAACARCHVASGFARYASIVSTNGVYTTNGAPTTYDPIDCQTCHEPHDGSNPHQLRLGETVLLADGVTTVTNAGAGTLCMNCHRSRNGAVSNSIYAYPKGLQTWAGGSGFGPHDNPASDMLEGVNGWTYGQVIPSSAHRGAVKDTCVGCHMQTVPYGDPAFLQAGGHTFSMTYTNSLGATIDKVDVCVQCHGPINSFDMVKIDYNGDGVIEGVQTEVQHLLDRLSTMLPPTNYVASGNYVADGVVKTSISVKTNWPVKFLEAGYNWQFVNNDLSKGVHNAAYAVGLLKASIGDLTGDANNDGIGDAWQIQYFGSTSNPQAAPMACPAGDGIPNWVKFSLGLNPLVAGTTMPDGVIWANAGVDQNGNTNSVQIYTAAEITFNTEIGKTYQLQSISSLAPGNWLNVGNPVQGTGQSYSFMTPTRNNTQQYYRVVHNP